MNVHIQMGGTDCGLFSLANATALCHGVDPTSCIYDQRQMRKHFWHCLLNRRMEVFPLQWKRQIMPQPVGVENFAVYCHCRLPWDRNHAQDDMTMCSMCRDWFHETCDNAQSNSQSQWGVQKIVKLALSNLCIWLTIHFQAQALILLTLTRQTRCNFNAFESPCDDSPISENLEFDLHYKNTV